MKRLLSILFLAASSLLAQQWQITSVEPSYIKEFAVAPNGDVYAGGAPGEFYRYSASDSVWFMLNNVSLEHRNLVINNSGDLINLPAPESFDSKVLISTDNGNTWENGEDINPFSGFILGDTLLSQDGIISTDGGYTWGNIDIGKPLYGFFVLSKNDIIYIELAANLIDYSGYYTVDLNGKTIKPLHKYAYKRPEFYNTNWVNENAPDSVELPFGTGGNQKPKSYFALDNKGNLIIYNGSRYIFRYKNDQWEIINYDPNGNDTSIPSIAQLTNDYAVSDSSVFHINYDSTFFLKQLPGKHRTGIHSEYEEVKYYNNALYIRGTGVAGSYNDFTFILYDLLKEKFVSLRKGIPGQAVTDMQNSNGELYAQTYAGYIYKSTNNGQTWEDFPANNYGKLTVLDSAIMVAQRYEGYAYISYNNGATWNKSINLIKQLNSDNKNIICARYDAGIPGHIQISTDYGKSWEIITANQYDVASVYTNNDYYLASTYNYDETSGVITPIVIMAGPNLIPDTTFTPAQVNSFTSIDYSYFGGTDSGVVKFEGTHIVDNRIFKPSAGDWVFTGLEGKKILSLTSDTTGVIYAGTEDGTYYSADLGANWDVYGTVVSGNLKKVSNNGLSQVKALLVNGAELFAAASEGLYKTKIYKAIANEREPNIAPDAFELKQNYPNPFNPVTNISFTLPEAAKVKLTVYDMLGREVETLVNMKLGAGSYSYRFNGSRLSSGIYIYRLETPDYRTARKMTLVK